MDFVKEDTPENNTRTEDAYVKKLQDTIRSVKENREMERSFMTWEDIRRESKAEGRLESKREDVLELLEEIGTVSGNLRDRILAETQLNVLKTMLKAASKAGSIEEFEEQISNLK